MRLAAVVCEACAIRLSDLIAFRSPDGSFRHISLVKQKRLDYLMDGSNDGTLTRAERKELERMVRECEEMSLHNTRNLANRRQAAGARRRAPWLDGGVAVGMRRSANS